MNKIPMLNQLKGNMPNFLLVYGREGDNKQIELRTFLYTEYDMVITVPKLTVDEVRRIKENCHAYSTTVCYLMEGTGSTVQAQNALLKLLEEPPSNVTFVMTTNENNIIETVQSRALMLRTRGYTQQELSKVDSVLGRYLKTPGEIERAQQELNVNEMVALCETVVDKLKLASYSNIFKVTERLDTSNDFAVEVFFDILEGMYLDKKKLQQCERINYYRFIGRNKITDNKKAVEQLVIDLKNIEMG